MTDRGALTPVATIEENGGDMFETAEHINAILEKKDSDYRIVHVSYGPTYLAVTGDEGPIQVLADFEWLEEDRYWDGTDELAKAAGDDGYYVIEYPPGDRQLARVDGDLP